MMVRSGTAISGHSPGRRPIQPLPEARPTESISTHPARPEADTTGRIVPKQVVGGDVSASGLC